MTRIVRRRPRVSRAAWLPVLAVLAVGCDGGASPASVAIQWQDLMPTDYRPNATLEQIDVAKWADNDPQAVALMDQLRAEWQNAPLVEQFNGQMVSLSGYVVPLQTHGTALKEFLLVPYYGACIHVPPPPPNQTVFVRSEEGLSIRRLFDTVAVTGRFNTERRAGELADAGYVLDATEIDLID
jgi:uncharacterized protein